MNDQIDRLDLVLALREHAQHQRDDQQTDADHQQQRDLPAVHGGISFVTSSSVPRRIKAAKTLYPALKFASMWTVHTLDRRSSPSGMVAEAASRRADQNSLVHGGRRRDLVPRSVSREPMEGQSRIRLCHQIVIWFTAGRAWCTLRGRPPCGRGLARAYKARHEREAWMMEAGSGADAGAAVSGDRPGADRDRPVRDPLVRARLHRRPRARLAIRQAPGAAARVAAHPDRHRRPAGLHHARRGDRGSPRLRAVLPAGLLSGQSAGGARGLAWRHVVPRRRPRRGRGRRAVRPPARGAPRSRSAMRSAPPRRSACSSGASRTSSTASCSGG